jgi:hypothetical protein
MIKCFFCGNEIIKTGKSIEEFIEAKKKADYKTIHDVQNRVPLIGNIPICKMCIYDLEGLLNFKRDDD